MLPCGEDLPVCALLTLISNNALAATFDWTRAHINTTYAVPHEIGDLYYFWQESGVLANSTVDYSVTADVIVTVGCRAKRRYYGLRHV